MEDPLSKILVVFLLVFLNAFFVAAEFAIVKAPVAWFERRAKEGGRRARWALRVSRHLDTYLSACQLGITLASLALGWVGEPFVARLLDPVIRGVGIHSETILHSLSFVIAFSTITFLHIVIGEQAPKSFAIRRAFGVALNIALPLRIFFVLFYPFIRLLNGASLLTLRLIGIRTTDPYEFYLTEADIRAHFTRSAANGEMTEQQSRMLERVLDFDDREAHQVMVPRTDMVVLSVESEVEENLKVAEKCGYTRFPLVEGSVDRVIGFAHVKDLYRAVRVSDQPVNLRNLRRDILFFPEHTPLGTILKEFQQKKVHLGIVLDEYGGTLGMLTLEDVIEELVGEIQDEFDRETPSVQRVGRDEFLLDGGCGTEECREQTGVIMPDTGADTVAGVLLDTVGDLPEEGTRVAILGAEMIVELVEDQRIKRVRMIRKTVQEGELSPRSGG
ncbi:MAG: HlyC/CorC family transporter [Candidatus Eisenbacteria bacterium]|nr:HlyC/CorC family transporter [Candidatus Eisenbacteria bacterium]